MDTEHIHLNNKSRFYVHQKTPADSLLKQNRGRHKTGVILLYN